MLSAYSALVVLSLWIGFAGVHAQAQSQRTQQPSIRVTGEASVAANPDQAKIDIGVVTQAERADAAALQNAERTDAVLAALRKTLGQGAEIKTISYSVNPNYRYPKEGAPVITGYTATNTLQVTLNDLKLVGKVIDAAVQFGANAIQRDRLRVDTLKWATARLLPRVYGRQAEEAGPPGRTIDDVLLAVAEHARAATVTGRGLRVS